MTTNAIELSGSLVGEPPVIFLDEAEQLADRIAILHQGRIIANGTLAELRALLLPAEVEYVERQPSSCVTTARGSPGSRPVTAWPFPPRRSPGSTGCASSGSGTG